MNCNSPKKWEYRITHWRTSGVHSLEVDYDVGGDLDDEDSPYFGGEWHEHELLDHIGSEGWELVSVIDHNNYMEYYFKRELEN